MNPARESRDALDGVAVAVVYVTYDSDAPLAAFLTSVAASTRPTDEVIVADNLPSRGNAELIAREHGARYLPMSENVGYGTAINRAVRSIPRSTEWILISNPDVVVDPQALDILVKTAEQDPGIAAVGPLVRNPDGSVYPSARRVPSIRLGIGHAFFANVWSSNPWTHAYHGEQSGAQETRDAGWLSGSCLLVRRQAFDEIGGFDDNFFMYFEDVDLGYRFGKAGWRNVYQPTAEVVHAGAYSTSKSSALMARAHHRSAEQFIAKKYAHPAFWPVRGIVLLGLRLRVAVIARGGRGRNG
jgi:N-acetylglucosaminyl-diphospho-decaprenol L-rhamnosyltransferase